MSNKWVRSISFNKTNTQDIARLKHIGKKSFSRYIKNLIDEDIKRQMVTPPATSKTATPPQRQRSTPTTTSDGVVFNPMLKRRP
jgi:hypothetical protein